MAKVIMIQGVASNAGKSVIAAGLCRIFYKDGLKTVPFKSQNMALNSYVTKEGFEIGRAQAMQAQACCAEPDVRMNPILLKPTSDMGSQVILNGRPLRNMNAKDYFKFKKKLVDDIKKAYFSLDKENDVIVIEGAGSPAEINLRENDIVNMGMAEIADAPVIIAADIDRGGVFASLYGTYMLLEDNEKDRVKGFIINKFRGDAEILTPGLEQIHKLTGVPVIGVIPYKKLDIDDEDSLSERISKREDLESKIKIGIIKLPKMSNYTDFGCFEKIDGVGVFYTENAEEIENFDMLIIPGSKNTVDDLLWLRQKGIEAEIKKSVLRGKIIFGICGGFQMMGDTISDPYNAESDLKIIKGIGLFNTKTVFFEDKKTQQAEGFINFSQGKLGLLNTLKIRGYEIHMGKTEIADNSMPLCRIDVGGKSFYEGCQKGNCYGTYIHGVFDLTAEDIVKVLFAEKNIEYGKNTEFDLEKYRTEQYDFLEELIRSNVDMEKVYSILNREI